MTSPSSAPLVKVKPLIWIGTGPLLRSHGHVGDERGAIVADIVWDRLLDEPLRRSSYRLWVAPRFQDDYPTLEAAQAAAQEEWNRFVRSAIEP